MKIKLIRSTLILLVVYLTTTLAHSTPTNIVLGYDSQYISEGRDNLVNGHLISVLAKTEFEINTNNNWHTSLWRAEAIHTNESYEELNLALGYSYTLNKLTITPHYTYLRFQHENTHDHEYGLDIEYQDIDSLAYSMSYIYSKQAGGSFFTWRITKTKKINDNLSVAPYLSLGVNNDYVVNEHNGWNDFQFGAEAIYWLNSQFKIQSYLANSRGLQKQRGESLEDFTWFGLSFGYFF